MGSESESVCVTGASGFVGSWLVMRLLERGYTVRATVRDPTNAKKVKHLLDLPKAATHLTLWKADLADEGSFDEAIEGCTGVFHVATPMDFESKDPENEVIKPTINGVLDIMKACLKAKTVRRLVFTASAGSVNVEETQKPVYNESNWSDVEFCRRVKMTGWMYFVSKTLAEQEAWKFAKENNIDFITIIPTLVIGPFLMPAMPPSLITGLSPLFGNEGHYSIIKQGQFVHLDDLCQSHIYLYEHPKAEGRYICSSHDATIHEIAKLLREKYPRFCEKPYLESKAMTTSTASLVLPSLTPKTLALYSPKPTSVSLFSLSSISSLKPISISASFLSSGKASRSFVRHVAVSDFEQDEEVLSGDEAEPNFSPDLKLFVGNLPFTVDSAQLADLFEGAGNVEMVEVIYDKTTGRSRGFGFVTMSSAQEVEAAARQFNGYELDGRALRVNYGPPPPRTEDSFRGARGGSPRGGGGYGDSSNRLYVGNLAWGVDNLALENLFNEQGKVLEAKVVFDRDSGRSRGFGFVTYGSAEEMNSAIESLDGVDLGGRSIRVTAAEPRPPRRQF